ncbi:MAG TPA: response regulator [Gemmatimonadaceae bacterium]|nr:response regulator [Gemmatimonadaceae bacterium]
MDQQPFVEDIETYAQDIVDTVREPLLMLDTDLRVQSANRAFYETFQVSAIETENQLIYHLGNGQWDIPSLRTLLEDVIPASSVFNDFELEHTFPKIGRRIMLLNGRKLRAGSHSAIIVLAMEDVTERRRSEADLRAIETYAQDIVDTVREPLLILDTTLRVQSGNRAFYHTFKVSPAETENRLIYELGNGQWDIPALRTLLEDIVPKSSVFNDFELAHDFPALGRRVMLLNARKLQAGHHGELVVLAMEDVTERRRAEEEASAAKEASEAANQTKSMFLANMSHELRTPLNAIVGYSEMLQEEATEQGLDSFVVDLDKIHASGRQLLGLINDILDLSKIEAGKMDLFIENFDLSALIDDVAATLIPMVKKNANVLKIERTPDLGGMRADQAKVRQALFNLLSNAAKFTHDGTITLHALRERMDDSEWIVFRIVDTGIGLTPEKLLRLFQDFTQADASTTRKFGGTGLGLALTRRFCQMMGGDVTVRSEDGAGSTFTIKLPAIVTDPETSETEDQPGEDKHPRNADRRDGDPAPAEGTCVLVIDDNASQRDLMRRYLSKEGYCVRSACSGEEGLRLARELRPIAITLDVMMPDMDGWEVLKALQADKKLSEIPVIMLTMVNDPERGMSFGATEYLTKPVNRQRLSKILKRYVGGAVLSPVLVVEHDEEIRTSMRTLLEKNGCRVTEAPDGAAALTLMETDRPTLIFLDLEGTDGFAFVEQVRKHSEGRSIPIVVVTTHELSPAQRKRLKGNVETIVYKSGESSNKFLSQVIDALDNSAVSRPAPV